MKGQFLLLFFLLSCGGTTDSKPVESQKAVDPVAFSKEIASTINDREKLKGFFPSHQVLGSILKCVGAIQIDKIKYTIPDQLPKGGVQVEVVDIKASEPKTHTQGTSKLGCEIQKDFQTVQVEIEMKYTNSNQESSEESLTMQLLHVEPHWYLWDLTTAVAKPSKLSSSKGAEELAKIYVEELNAAAKSGDGSRLKKLLPTATHFESILSCTDSKPWTEIINRYTKLEQDLTELKAQNISFAFNNAFIKKKKIFRKGEQWQTCTALQNFEAGTIRISMTTTEGQVSNADSQVLDVLRVGQSWFVLSM